MRPDDEHSYPEPKRRELSEIEKLNIRSAIQDGQARNDIADAFDCTTSQVAGLKAAITRGQ